MPLLFLVAGFGARHSLRRRGPGRFAVERLLRLGVPLVFATLTIVPVPQWLRLRAEPGYDENYLEFLPRFFAVRFAPGDFPFVLRGEVFETGHLWFVVLLLAFSLMLVAVVARIPRRVKRRGVEEGLAAWSRWAYLLFLLAGFVIATDERFGAALRRHGRIAAVLAVVAFGAGAPGFMTAGRDLFLAMTPPAVTSRMLFSVAGWCSLVAIVVPWRGPIIVEYAVIVVVSLLVTFGAYDILVRRTRVTRFLFGMRAERT